MNRSVREKAKVYESWWDIRKRTLLFYVAAFVGSTEKKGAALVVSSQLKIVVPGAPITRLAVSCIVCPILM